MSYDERSHKISADVHRAITDLIELIREQVTAIVARTQLDAVRAQEQVALLAQRVERLSVDVNDLRTMIVRHMTDEVTRLERIESLMSHERRHDK